MDENSERGIADLKNVGDDNLYLTNDDNG